jgi:hypothetical protein
MAPSAGTAATVIEGSEIAARISSATRERSTSTPGAADPGEFMINTVVEVDDAWTCSDFALPADA